MIVYECDYCGLHETAPNWVEWGSALPGWRTRYATPADHSTHMLHVCGSMCEQVWDKQAKLEEARGARARA